MSVIGAMARAGLSDTTVSAGGGKDGLSRNIRFAFCYMLGHRFSNASFKNSHLLSLSLLLFCHVPVLLAPGTVNWYTWLIESNIPEIALR